MTGTPQNTPNSDAQPTQPIDAEPLFRSLRRKEGTWVEWGNACQQLQKAGYSTQQIFEETGFEPIQQNQVIVAAQVYTTMIQVGISEAVKQRFERRSSDILYELRILTQPERAAAAELIVEKSLDTDDARELAKAMKDFSRLSTIPEGFSNAPGDTMAYQCWKFARQKADLQERSRLIAKGLRYVQTPAARQKIEQLLTDFTVTPNRPAPRLPIYRPDSETDMPRVLPVVGKLPLTATDLQAVPLVEEIWPFRMVKFTGGTGAWVAIPGWQVVLNAEDPVVILQDSDQLPTPLPGRVEEVLLVVDRTQRQWDVNSYFLIAIDQQLQVQWFEEAPEIPLVGKVILVMRPKQVLDEEYTKEAWQIDE